MIEIRCDDSQGTHTVSTVLFDHVADAQVKCLSVAVDVTVASRMGFIDIAFPHSKSGRVSVAIEHGRIFVRIFDRDNDDNALVFFLDENNNFREDVASEVLLRHD